jgi:hypothetical protein
VAVLMCGEYPALAALPTFSHGEVLKNKARQISTLALARSQTLDAIPSLRNKIWSAHLFCWAISARKMTSLAQRRHRLM